MEKRWCKIVFRELSDNTFEMEFIGEDCDKLFGINQTVITEPKKFRRGSMFD